MSGAEKQKAVLGLDIASKSTACRTSPVLKPDAEAEREQFTDIEKSTYSQVDAVGYTDPNAVQHLIVKCVVVVNPFSVRTFANTDQAESGKRNNGNHVAFRPHCCCRPASAKREIKRDFHMKSDNLRPVSPEKPGR